MLEFNKFKNLSYDYCYNVVVFSDRSRSLEASTGVVKRKAEIARGKIEHILGIRIEKFLKSE